MTKAVFFISLLLACIVDAAQLETIGSEYQAQKVQTCPNDFPTESPIDDSDIDVNTNILSASPFIIETTLHLEATTQVSSKLLRQYNIRAPPSSLAS